jgi:hypothetical protein
VAIAIGAAAPDVGGLTGPHALVFYKVTCSVTNLAGPALARLGAAYEGAVLGVGQDPQPELEAFATAHGWTFPQIPDLAPYEASDAYGIASAPTLVVINGGGRVADVVESWDREGMNRASATLAGLLGAEPEVLSTEADGLPAFKPG